MKTQDRTIRDEMIKQPEKQCKQQETEIAKLRMEVDDEWSIHSVGWNMKFLTNKDYLGFTLLGWSVILPLLIMLWKKALGI